MSNLMKAEFYKLYRNKTFWVVAGTVTGLSALLHLLIIFDWWQLSGTEFDQAGLSELNALSPFKLPLFFNLIVSTVAGYYIATDFSQSGVIKNQLLSGNRRSYIYLAKLLVFSLASILAAIVIPLVTALITVTITGYGEIFSPSSVMYLERAYCLFTLQFLCFTSIVLLIAVVTEDSGKTILFTLLLSIVMFAIEKLTSEPIIRFLYEHTFFYQFSDAFKISMSTGEVVTSIAIGAVELIVITSCGIFLFNRKEMN
ncbi:ABC transporter permease [Mangrovibacillus sp. Mu-81]|uniref:ABC transporter permease n=1 Tax=Mangrovibacillus sp. Mu-81 TaxID=3121478 RepID=UPI002FE4B519